MNRFLFLYKNLFYHRLDIRIAATGNTIWDAWSGAIIRNNLLYAAEQIYVEKTQKTLRETINDFPLLISHPLYNALKDGFPKGYQISLLSHINLDHAPLKLSPNEIVSFSLILIGNMSEYYHFFIQAIRLMCNRGLGKPQHPFLLIDVCEHSNHNESQIVAIERTNLIDKLRFPVYFDDYFWQEEKTEICSELFVHYTTPIILFRSRNKKNTQLSYQDKCNLFPGFYQLVRSAFFRLSKLHVIYIDANDYPANLQDEGLIESFLQKAGYPILQSANISRVVLQNTLKKERVNTMPLAGYIGEQVYSGYFNDYLPLLKFMEEIGVGNEVVYGMGRYRVEIKNKKLISKI